MSIVRRKLLDQLAPLNVLKSAMFYYPHHQTAGYIECKYTGANMFYRCAVTESRVPHRIPTIFTQYSIGNSDYWGFPMMTQQYRDVFSGFYFVGMDIESFEITHPKE